MLNKDAPSVKKARFSSNCCSKGVKFNSLSSKASLIPIINLSKISSVIGKNTKTAVRSGFYWGYVGLINNIILKIEKETKKKYRVIFTGGYADLFKTSIKRPFTIDKHITIKGIIEIFRKNKEYLY